MSAEHIAQPDAEAPHPDWTRLPPDLLKAILHPWRTGKGARRVCQHFRAAYDAGVNSTTLRLRSPLSPGQHLLSAPPCAAATVRLDVSSMRRYCAEADACTGQWDIAGLAQALQCWPVEGPLELDLSACGLSMEACRLGFDDQHVDGGVGLLAETLRCPTFAPGGLQVLDLSCNDFANSGARLLASTFGAAHQFSGLRELRLAHCRMAAAGVGALCSALCHATHIRSLATLDLSGNNLGTGGAAALVGCLRHSPHIAAGLQQLLLSATGMCADAASTLASAVADTGVALKRLDITENRFGGAGAAAWGAALQSTTRLASLEDLNVDLSGADLQGMGQLWASMQAATHLARLRRFGVGYSDCGPLARSWSGEMVLGLARLLSAAPHLGSVQELVLRNVAINDSALLALWRTSFPGPALPHLRRLCVSRCHVAVEGDRYGLFAPLLAATQRSCLEELNLEYWDPHSIHTATVASALASSTYLAGLRKLVITADPRVVAGMLREAPHLHGLTSLKLSLDQLGRCGFVDVRAALKCLPSLRKLELVAVPCAHAKDVRALTHALDSLPELPSLKELIIGTACVPHEPADEAVRHLALALQACTDLAGLRCLELSVAALGDGGCSALCGVLGASRHLSGLQELRLTNFGPGRFSSAIRQTLREGLRTGHLAGVLVAIT